MYAITGITGQVGGSVARSLLAAGSQVRAVVRDPRKAEDLAAAGAEIAVADLGDAAALTTAFTGVEGVFVMIPANFAPAPGFPETRAVLLALKTALLAAHPPKVVALSSIGAQHTTGLGLITQLHILEEELGDLPVPVAFIRPGWFTENAKWDIEPARRTGELQSFLQPLDRAVPMVATADVGRVTAEALLSTWTGRRVVELEGPRRYAPDDLAVALGDALGRKVQAVAVPRAQWTALFEASGTPVGRTEPRAEMVDGFNSGWIEFERAGSEPLRGHIALDTVLKEMMESAEA